MSKRNIPNVDWINQLESVIRQFVKEKLELIMREEIKHFLEIEQAGTPNRGNGYYQQYGRIEGLLVPRDRNGEFQTQLFAPYQRHTGWLEEAIISMYQIGKSTREIGKFIERILGIFYIYFFVLYVAPKTFYENIVQSTSFTVHADLNFPRV